MERPSGVPGEPSASQQRAANLRMIALASAVALAVVLPLAAATAGPARTEKSPRRATGFPGDGGRSGGAGPSAALAAGRSSEGSQVPDGARNGAGGGLPSDAPAVLDGDGSSDSRRLGGTGVRDSARCGPELAAPEGVEAQTCVLRQGADTWGRTYFRNATGGPLTAVLTLMEPDGRTVEVRCQTGPSDDPGSCETPHAEAAHDRRALDAYSAVTEVAAPDGKLLLRSGSNSPGGPAD
ncbi:hypothetical protein CTZ27_12660 [Streptomyces griseocarneus]|nr:hypothetical protein CTZ27_12660 [Streptomyces griseocarneus]